MLHNPAGKIFSGYAGRWHVREERDGIAVRRTWVYAGTGKSASIRLAIIYGSQAMTVLRRQARTQSSISPREIAHVALATSQIH